MLVRDAEADLRLHLDRVHTVKPVLSSHSKIKPNIGFQDGLLLNAGRKYCRMLHESILQYFQPSLSYHLSLRPLFFLCLSGRFRQVLLYATFIVSSNALQSLKNDHQSHLLNKSSALHKNGFWFNISSDSYLQCVFFSVSNLLLNFISLRRMYIDMHPEIIFPVYLCIQSATINVIADLSDFSN